MNEDEEFFAWLDRELDGEAAERVAARVAGSAELTRRAEQHRKLVAGLRQAFQPVIDASSEPPWVATEVIDFGARATERRSRWHWLAAPRLAAMAASLAIGVVAGGVIFGSGGYESPVAVAGGQLVAAGALDQALDTQLASTPAAEGPRIVLTFRDGSGRICRSFREAAATGLACREGGQWRINGLFPTGEGQEGSYRMAAGEDPRLAALIDDTISGEPFDATQERAARASGWR